MTAGLDVGLSHLLTEQRLKRGWPPESVTHASGGGFLECALHTHPTTLWEPTPATECHSSDSHLWATKG